MFDDLTYVHMQWEWMDPRLVVIPVLVALVTAMLAVHVCTRAQRTAPGPRRTGMAAAGVLLLGGGIWSMHFIGTQAFTPCAAGTFSILHSALSALPSLLAAGVVVHTLLLALGLGLAMALFSVVLYRRMQSVGARPMLITLVSGGVMGTTTASMHYIAMDAIYILVGQGGSEAGATQVHWTTLTSAAAWALLVGTVLLVLHMLMRSRQLFLEIRRNEARLRALVDTAVDGIIMIESDGRISAFNPAAERLLGWTEQEVLGRNVSMLMLMPMPHQQAHDGYLQRHISTGHTNIIGAGREVQALHKNGALIDVRLAVGRATNSQTPIFVGFLTDIRQGRTKHGRVLWVQTTFSPILDASGAPLRVMQLVKDITASRTLAQELLNAKEKAETAAAAHSGCRRCATEPGTAAGSDAAPWPPGGICQRWSAGTAAAADTGVRHHPDGLADAAHGWSSGFHGHSCLGG